jgi:hypothetical protein
VAGNNFQLSSVTGDEKKQEKDCPIPFPARLGFPQLHWTETGNQLDLIKTAQLSPESRALTEEQHPQKQTSALIVGNNCRESGAADWM